MPNIEHRGITRVDPESRPDIVATCNPLMLPIAAAGMSALTLGLRHANNLRATDLANLSPILHGLPNPNLVEALSPGGEDERSGSRLALDGLTIIASALQSSQIFGAQPVLHRDYTETDDTRQTREQFTIREAELPIPPRLREAAGTAMMLDGPQTILARITAHNLQPGMQIRRTKLQIVTRLPDVLVTDTLRTVDYPQTNTTNIQLTRAFTDGVVAEPQDASYQLLAMTNNVIAGVISNSWGRNPT